MSNDTKIRYVGLTGLGILAVWLTLNLGSSLYLCLASLRWPTVPARVIFSGVTTGSSNLGNWWAPEVEYQYQVEGHAYRGENIRYLMPAFYHEEEARAVQAGYRQEEAVRVAYDPRDPGRSVLEPGVPAGMWQRALIPFLFWALAGYVFYGIKHPGGRFVLQPRSEEAG